MTQTLQGQVALVTGAASGIGAAIADAFAAEGAHLVLADLDLAGAEATAERARAAGVTASAHRVDLTDADATRALVDEAVDRHQRLDVLAHCAGMLTQAALGSWVVE